MTAAPSGAAKKHKKTAWIIARDRLRSHAGIDLSSMNANHGPEQGSARRVASGAMDAGQSSGPPVPQLGPINFGIHHLDA
jgi:hypothetical protein